MFAGVHIFTRYLDEPLIACMHRIQGSTKIRSNLHSNWNKDLRILYEVLMRERCVQGSIMAITGIQFTSENFVSLWQHSGRQPQHGTLASQPYRTSQILQSNVGREVRAQITAADAETTVNAEATHEREMPWSGRQIVAFDGVVALTGQYPFGTWRISRSSEFRPVLILRNQNKPT
jgi:hypothetical protein